ncbi:hypothetical protein SAMN00790413_03357 [Deinococcus hopiensis KR-140]|uniref:Uncharacterized protein n=1 Tax=Deinococcus hopiensis KR-140 TaxID=695939 RepID=A0A1W1UX79_9DEIO|nr:hypothetical protein SAMN00790413_03357 [Deinococcus hopiensis KR-140]
MDHCSSVSHTFLAYHTTLSQNSNLFPDDLYFSIRRNYAAKILVPAKYSIAGTQAILS